MRIFHQIMILFLLTIGMGFLSGCAENSEGPITNIAGLTVKEDNSEKPKVDKVGDTATTDRVDNTNSKQKKKNKHKPIASKNFDPSAYYIGAHDELEITVFRVPSLSKSIQVASEGTINFPLIGQVMAEGKTAKQVEQILTAKLGEKYLRNPQVSVFVKEFNSRRVTINGDVKKPGVYPIRGKMTLMSLVATAEGLRETADSTIAIFRVKNGKRHGARFDISAIRSGNAKDPVLRSDDVVIVGKSAIKSAFHNFLKVVPLVATFAAL